MMAGKGDPGGGLTEQLIGAKMRSPITGHENQNFPEVLQVSRDSNPAVCRVLKGFITIVYVTEDAKPSGESNQHREPGKEYRGEMCVSRWDIEYASSSENFICAPCEDFRISFAK